MCQIPGVCLWAMAGHQHFLNKRKRQHSCVSGIPEILRNTLQQKETYNRKEQLQTSNSLPKEIQIAKLFPYEIPWSTNSGQG